MSWPPTLAQVKGELKIDLDDTRDDDQLTARLNAAVAFVERVVLAPDLDACPPHIPTATADIELGTLLLASRWHARRRSPEMLITAGEFGGARIPSFDPDIERMLGIGRHVESRFA